MDTQHQDTDTAITTTSSTTHQPPTDVTGWRAALARLASEEEYPSMLSYTQEVRTVLIGRYGSPGEDGAPRYVVARGREALDEVTAAQVDAALLAWGLAAIDMQWA